MSDLNPYKITENEWKEIVALPEVREAWGLDDDIHPEEFASRNNYGVKFDFVSGGPGYVGDLFILQGDALSDGGLMLLRRDREGHLIICRSES